MYQSLPPHQDITPSIPASVSESEGVVRDVREQVGSIQLQMMPDAEIIENLERKWADRHSYTKADIISAVLGRDERGPINEATYRICYKKLWELFTKLSSVGISGLQPKRIVFEEIFWDYPSFGMVYDGSVILSSRDFAEGMIHIKSFDSTSNRHAIDTNQYIGTVLTITRVKGLITSIFEMYELYGNRTSKIDYVIEHMIPRCIFSTESGQSKDPIAHLYSLHYISDFIYISCLGAYHWLHDDEDIQYFIGGIKAHIAQSILIAPTPFLRDLGQALLAYPFEEYLDPDTPIADRNLPLNYESLYLSEIVGYGIHASPIKTNHTHASLPKMSPDELKTATHAIFGGNTNLLDAVLGFSMDSMDIPMHLRILLLSFLVHADGREYQQARSYLQRSKNEAELSERISSLLSMAEHPRALEQLTHLEMLLIERLGDKKGKKAFHGILQKYHDVTGVITGQDIKLDTVITDFPTEVVDHEKVSKSLISYADRIIKDAIDGIEHGEADYALQKVSQIKHKLAQHVRISSSVTGSHHDQIRSLSDTLSTLRMEMNSISAKDLKKKDIKFLYCLYEQQYHGRKNIVDIIDTSLKTYLDDKNSRFYFFSYDKSPFLTLRCTKIDEQSVELGAFFSRAEAQGTQIAGYLIGRSFLEEIGAQNIYASVDPKAHKLIQYYQEFGFQPVYDGDMSRSIETHPNGTQSLRLIYRK